MGENVHVEQHTIRRPSYEFVRHVVTSLYHLHLSFGSLNADQVEELTGCSSPYEPTYIAIKYILNKTFGVDVFPHPQHWGIRTLSINFQGRRRDDVWEFRCLYDDGIESPQGIIQSVAMILVATPEVAEAGELFLQPTYRYLATAQQGRKPNRDHAGDNGDPVQQPLF